MSLKDVFESHGRRTAGAINGKPVRSSCFAQAFPVFKCQLDFGFHIDRSLSDGMDSACGNNAELVACEEIDPDDILIDREIIEDRAG